MAEQDEPVEHGQGLTDEELEQASVEVKREFWVNIHGRWYPTWQGVLDAATRAGLKSLIVSVEQLPTKENGMLAVVRAQATFEDGRVYCDLGDCSPASTSPQLAPSIIRLASTRAKGRVLRDAINCGTPSQDEVGHAGGGQRGPGQRGQGGGPPPAAPRPSRNGEGQGETFFCEVCGIEITKNQRVMSQHHTQQNLCPDDLGKARQAARTNK